MLRFWIPVTISELAFTLALSGDPSMSSTKAIAASAGLGAVDFLCVFGIRNKSEKAAPNRGLNSPLFIRVFIAPTDHCLRLWNFTQPEPQRNCQYDSPEMTIVRPPA
jgi:hypothetical protein